jgi:guanylate kinase
MAAAASACRPSSFELARRSHLSNIRHEQPRPIRIAIRIPVGIKDRAVRSLSPIQDLTIERYAMTVGATGRLVILSGPSCVGKSPLDRALGKFYPHLRNRLKKLVLFNSRAPRPGELDGADYHFRTRSQVEALKGDSRYAVLEVRGDLQALDVEDLKAVIQQDDAFFEGNPYMGRLLHTHPRLTSVNRLSIFLSPLSKEEITYLKAPERNISLREFVADVMRRKLLRRARRHKGEPSLKDLENIERRASSAYAELTEAWHFQYVIPNHDGEDSDNWEAFYYPIGDARRSLDAVAALLQGIVPLGPLGPLGPVGPVGPVGVEKWESELLPSGS